MLWTCQLIIFWISIRVENAASEEELYSAASLKLESGHHGPRPSCVTSKSFKLLKDAFVFLLAFWGLFSILYHLSSLIHREGPRGCDCGSSTAEALRLGCKYDSLAAAWLPEHCRDDELTAEFERSGDGPNGTVWNALYSLFATWNWLSFSQWIYYADTRHTIQLSLEEIALMADDPEARFHMSAHWHKIHCIFYWRKEHRFRFNEKMVEPRSDSEEHIHHCGEIFLGKGYGTISGVVLNTDQEWWNGALS